MSVTSVIEIDDLVREVQSCYPDADEALLRRAYEFSARAHEGQTRRSGEPYLQHPLAVAGILTFLKAGRDRHCRGASPRYAGRYRGDSGRVADAFWG